MNRSVSLKDVAKYAGVGLGTASRVLNNHPSVTEETRKLVLDAIEKLNYKPNAIARSLKMNSTMTIGVIIPDISSAFYPEIVKGIDDIANEHQYNIILCNSDLDYEKEKTVLSVFYEKKVDGILFISNTLSEGTFEKIIGMNIPVVLVATKDEKGILPSVTIDNKKAAFAAVDYLCKLGHRKIGMIAGYDTDPNAGYPRIEGYKEALINNNVVFEEELIFEGDYDYKSGYEGMKKFLSENKLISAIFAASDAMAIGASKAILERDLRIPEDISVFGFDGIEAAEFFYPSISTVKQPRYEMGAEAARLLTKIMNKEVVEGKNIVLDVKLVERESCKKLI